MIARHAVALAAEIEYRTGRARKAVIVLSELAVAVDALPLVPFQPPPACMPDAYKGADVVESCGRFYRAEKSRFAVYTRRPAPAFMRSTELSNADGHQQQRGDQHAEEFEADRDLPQ